MNVSYGDVNKWAPVTDDRQKKQFHSRSPLWTSEFIGVTNKNMSEGLLTGVLVTPQTIASLENLTSASMEDTFLIFV